MGTLKPETMRHKVRSPGKAPSATAAVGHAHAKAKAAQYAVHWKATVVP